MVKNSLASAGDAGGDMGSIPVLGISHGRGNANPFQYSCLKKFHGQRSLVGYSPWDYKELDTTEQLTLSLSGYYLSSLTIWKGDILALCSVHGKSSVYYRRDTQLLQTLDDTIISPTCGFVTPRTILLVYIYR